MGIDLILLPYDSSFFSHTVLRVDRDYDLYDAIRDIPSKEVDDNFTSYVSRDDQCEETHYGKTIENPYGQRTAFVLAKDLKRVRIPGPTGAYIRELDDDCKVALYWCQDTGEMPPAG